MTLQERFDAKYEIVEPGGCWVWMAAININGYGAISVGSTTDNSDHMEGAHRISYELHRGPIPEGIHVLHKCDVRLCVRPDHLFLGAQLDNMRDMAAKGRSACGEKNGRSKFTDETVTKVRALAGKMLQREIGELFGISQPHVSYLLNTETCRRRRALL